MKKTKKKPPKRSAPLTESRIRKLIRDEVERLDSISIPVELLPLLVRREPQLVMVYGCSFPRKVLSSITTAYAASFPSDNACQPVSISGYTPIQTKPRKR